MCNPSVIKDLARIRQFFYAGMEMSIPNITPPPRFHCGAQPTRNTGAHSTIPGGAPEAPTDPSGLLSEWRSINASDQPFRDSALCDKYKTLYFTRERRRREAATCSRSGWSSSAALGGGGSEGQPGSRRSKKKNVTVGKGAYI